MRQGKLYAVFPWQLGVIALVLGAAWWVNQLAFDPDAVPRLEPVWETDAVFMTPESVLYDAGREVLYVANVNGGFDTRDGNGFISRLGLDGTVLELEWATGLNAPKGMAIQGGRLYVADLNELVEIDLASGAIVGKHSEPGAQFFNDVALDARGRLFVTDTFAQRVYTLTDAGLAVWLEDARFAGLNGLWVERDRLLTGSFQSGALYAVSLDGKAISVAGEGFGAQDGVVAVGRRGYLVSNFQGEVYWTTLKAAPVRLLDTRAQGRNAADIGYAARHRLLLVPTFSGNVVSAYRVAF